MREHEPASRQERRGEWKCGKDRMKNEGNRSTPSSSTGEQQGAVGSRAVDDHCATPEANQDSLETEKGDEVEIG